MSVFSWLELERLGHSVQDLMLLAVDDDELVIQAVRLALPAQWRMMATKNHLELPDRGILVALVDIHLTGHLASYEGLEVIRSLKHRFPHAEIIAVSGNSDRLVMEQCLACGASRFLAKPLNLVELTLTLDKIETLARLQAAQGWVGSSPASQSIRRQIAQLTNESGPILIEGESGTGKEVTAQLLHAQRPLAPFVVVNVAGVPENLFEAEFFGHLKGAFTGAEQNKIGLVEAAHGGDLFLDEIEALSLPLQAKLLRFLESGEVRRIGGRDMFRIETRVIVATNRNLAQMVRDGQFREDLLWRLSGKKIVLPPLRERPADIPDLARHFLAQDRFRRKHLSDDAMEALIAHSWPGNARELKRACEQFLVAAPLPVLRREDVLRVLRPTAQGATLPEQALYDLTKGLARLMAEFEGHILQKALSPQNDIDEVARLLKISRSSLYKKIKDHDIQWRSNE